jgi:hypothetical protein
MVTRGGGGAMVTMDGSRRPGQPTNAVVIKTALTMATILRISKRFCMELPLAIKCGRVIATDTGSVNTTKAD